MFVPFSRILFFLIFQEFLRFFWNILPFFLEFSGFFCIFLHFSPFSGIFSIFFHFSGFSGVFWLPSRQLSTRISSRSSCHFCVLVDRNRLEILVDRRRRQNPVLVDRNRLGFLVDR